MRHILSAIVGVCCYIAFVSWTHQPSRTAGMAGEVHCVDGYPKIKPPLPNLVGLARAENVRHEATHGSQFAVGCDSIAQAWKDDPAFRLALESEAQCSGLTVYPDSVKHILIGERTALLTRLYLPTFGFEDVAEALAVWCHDS